MPDSDMILDSPQSFVVKQECGKVTWQNGYRRVLDEIDGWAHFGSTTARGMVAIASEGADGRWFLAIDHSGVIEELALAPADIAGPGLARYSFDTLGELYAVMPQVYDLGVALPDAPLETFIEKTKNLPRTTEAERLVVQRVGQDVFRNSLLKYWNNRCSLTGIQDLALLRASHIIPWRKCPDDAERLNPFNGLLLSALWDAAFDKGLVTFDDDGQPLFSPNLSSKAQAELRWNNPLPLRDKHRERLNWHRSHLFQQGSSE